MKRFILVLAFLCCCVPRLAASQGAFDRDCYYPEVGVPNEIDTIYGSSNEQYLGYKLKNLGPAPNGGLDRVTFSGLGPNLTPANHSFNIYETGPNPNLHKLVALSNTNIPLGDCQFAHLRSSAYLDAVLYYAEQVRIFWADGEGNYDSTRSTLLKPDSGWTGWSVPQGRPIIFEVGDDTVASILLFWGRLPDTLTVVSTFICRYDFTKLSSAETGLPLSTVFFGRAPGGYVPIGLVGDFRGIGRKSFLAGDHDYNAFFFSNEGSFSLESFAQSMRSDTLWAFRQNPILKNLGEAGVKVSTRGMKAFPKLKGDQSEDLVSQQGDNGRVYFFRGGPDFGKKRLFFDSADYVLKTPFELEGGGGGFYGGPVDCGDMTGTGNRVLLIRGAMPGSFQYFFYVTGKALDSKVDMAYYFDQRAEGMVDTLSMGQNGLQNILIGMPYYYSLADLNRHKENVGTVHLIHGSKQIPVKINPAYSVAESVGAPVVRLFPNPSRDYLIVELPPLLANTQIEVLSPLGTTVLSLEAQASVQGSQQSFYVGDLANGSYLVRIKSSPLSMSKLVVLH